MLHIYPVGKKNARFCPLCGYDAKSIIPASGAPCPECGKKIRRDELKAIVPESTSFRILAGILILLPFSLMFSVPHLFRFSFMNGRVAAQIGNCLFYGGAFVAPIPLFVIYCVFYKRNLRPLWAFCAAVDTFTIMFVSGVAFICFVFIGLIPIEIAG